MATYLLIRHAKAERPPGVADIDRDLAERGETDAVLVGAFLATALPAPVRVFSSPARRARRTAEMVAAAAGWSAPIETDERLYGGSIGDLFELLGATAADPVAAFGHEPFWSGAAATMIGGGAIHLVTAAAVCLEGTPEPGGAVLRWMVAPVALGGGPG